ncbi:MAG: hypothetical protein CBARDMAM_7197, partial [uncultured Caballeronia sp.]
RTRDLLIGTSAGRQKTVLQKQDRFAFPSDAAIWRRSLTARSHQAVDVADALIDRVLRRRRKNDKTIYPLF